MLTGSSGMRCNNVPEYKISADSVNTTPPPHNRFCVLAGLLDTDPVFRCVTVNGSVTFRNPNPSKVLTCLNSWQVIRRPSGVCTPSRIRADCACMSIQYRLGAFTFNKKSELTASFSVLMFQLACEISVSTTAPD